MEVEVDMWMCGCVDMWMCGCVDVWKWMQLQVMQCWGGAATVGCTLGSAHPGCFPGKQQLSAKESETVSVQCHYKIADYGAVTKAWCKKEGEMCNVLASTSSEPPAENSTARDGVRIQDDRQQGIVTVTMQQLQLQDSGVYWCALQEPSALSRMEEVTLRVSRGGYGSGRTPLWIPDSLDMELWVFSWPPPCGRAAGVGADPHLLLLNLGAASAVLRGV